MLLDYSQIKYQLAERYNNKRRLGIHPGSRPSSEENDIQSGLAEYYASQVLGCKCNFDVLNGSDGGFDFIYKNYKVDVKWLGWLKGTRIPRNSGRIIVDLHKLTADIYVAVCGDESSGFNISGWCWADDLKNAPIWISNYPDDRGVYERYAIHTRDLRSL